MSAMQGAISAAERSMRSVFVGNIPYEATEEQLKDIFSEVGPVVSFRLVYDRETGKPKGYGFCEYKDQEMALSAMRNLNGFELNGRALRVDNAASEKSKEELKNLQASLGGPPVESPYGPEVEPEKAPEEISKAVASLPPEQMFELMKQMKMCIQNNPNEARNLLLQNPQLAYALLQAQVIMRIVDPQIATGILHRQGPPAASQAEPEPAMGTVPPVSKMPSSSLPMTVPYTSQPVMPMNELGPIPMSAAGIHGTAPMPVQGNPAVIAPGVTAPMVRPSLLGDRPPVMAEQSRLQGPINQYPERVSSLIQHFPYNVYAGMDAYPADPRTMGDRDLRQPADRDLRMPQGVMVDKDMRQAAGDQDLRHMANPPVSTDGRPYDPRYRALQGADPSRGGPGFDRQRAAPYDPRTAYEGRVPATSAARVEDPRNGPGRAAVQAGSSPIIPQSSPSAVSQQRPPPAIAAAAAAIAPHDQEKAALIMQVLQLSDQQIAMLPPEQRQSIMILKEQIARSQQQH